MKRSHSIMTLALAVALAACGGDEDCSITNSCPNQAPTATITAPADGASTTVGLSVTFSGSATDAEDGAITGAALVWTSDLDGTIGSGASFSRSDLSGGFHRIVLTATDSDGMAGADSIDFAVGGGPSTAITAPTNQAGGAPRTVTLGTGVTFTGSAVDVEDGPLGGGSLVWVSNLDGQIGTGTSFATSTLSAGMHTVTLTATDSDTNESKRTVLVIVKPANATGYQIHIRNAEGVELSAAQQSAVDAAVTKLQSIITGDVPNLASFQFAGGDCGGATVPPLNESADDVIIYLEFVPIDGPSGTIGSAGPCLARGGTNFSLLGGMRFDTADLQLLDDLGLLEDIVLHEMMHVLGFGIFWDSEGLLEQPSDPTNDNHTPGMTDTHFTGTNAIAQFNAIGGGSYTGGNVVPVENDTTEFDSGSLDGHWREDVFVNEIMSTAANLPPNPLSVVTIGQFADLGYVVDYGAADTYDQTFSIVLGDEVAGRERPSIDLTDDVWRGPIHSVEPDGSLRRIR